MGKSDPPPAPDPVTTANAQATANRGTAEFNTALNRANQVGPGGSSTWSTRPGADPNNPQAGDYTQTVSLSPDQQRLYDSSNRISQNLAGVAEAGLNRVGAGMATPYDQSSLPQLANSVQTTSGQLQGAPTAGNLTTSVDTSGLPQLANGGSYGDQVKAVQDATYARLAPQLSVNREQEENKLLNSGIERGTQAWDDAQRVLGNRETDAQMQSVLAGSQEQSRLAGLDASKRAQLFGEGTANANLNNTAQNTAYTQGLAGANLNNANVNTAFQQDQSAATFGNQARTQAMQEQSYLRQLPLNELNALRTGAQVQSPNFGGYYTGGQAGQADITGLVKDAYGNEVAATNAKNAQIGQGVQAGATAYMMAAMY